MTFRVHYDNGTKKDIEADSPNQAREIAMKKPTGLFIVKIKRLRSEEARG